MGIRLRFLVSDLPMIKAIRSLEHGEPVDVASLEETPWERQQRMLKTSKERTILSILEGQKEIIKERELFYLSSYFGSGFLLKDAKDGLARLMGDKSAKGEADEFESLAKARIAMLEFMKSASRIEEFKKFSYEYSLFTVTVESISKEQYEMLSSLTSSKVFTVPPVDFFDCPTEIIKAFEAETPETLQNNM